MVTVTILLSYFCESVYGRVKTVTLAPQNSLLLRRWTAKIVAITPIVNCHIEAVN